MAQSRVERINTIYYRVASLLRSGALKPENKPLWLDVYEAFPPKYEPRFDRQLPSKPVKAIFYKEDLVRARFHKNQSSLPVTDLLKDNVKSATQKFLSMYEILKEEVKSEDSAYEQAMQKYTAELEQRMELRKEEKNYDKSSGNSKYNR